jgi:hypothetical protein
MRGEAEVCPAARLLVTFVRTLRRGDRVVLRLRGLSDPPLEGHCTADGLLNVFPAGGAEGEGRLVLRLERVARGIDLRLRMDVPLDDVEGAPLPPPPHCQRRCAQSCHRCLRRPSRADRASAGQPALIPAPPALSGELVVRCC